MTTLHESVAEKPAERKGAEQPAAVAAAAVPTGPARPRSTDQLSFEPIASSSGPSSIAQESLSSASSFQSLASTLSSKSSSGICADSAPGSPEKSGFDHSYVNVDIPDLDDLISACANINLNSALGGVEEEKEADAGESPDSSADLSHDQTFASAADNTLADETAINLLEVEQTLQTFQTCPGLESTQISTIVSSTTAVFKEPLPVVIEQSPASSVSSSTSSVIPYLSFEDSVLRKHQGDELEFKSALTSFLPLQAVSSPRSRISVSPTPCIEIDVAEVIQSRLVSEAKKDGSFVAVSQDIVVVAEAVKSSTERDAKSDDSIVTAGQDNVDVAEAIINSTKSETASESPFISGQDNADILLTFADNSEQIEQHYSAALGSPDVTFEEVAAFDSTVILGPESESASKTSEKLNSTEFFSALPTKNLNVTVELETQNKSEIIKESEIPITNIIVEKEVETSEVNQNIVSAELHEVKALNDTQVITQETNFNKTQEFIQDNVPNEFEIVLKEKDILNQTGVNLQKENNLNKTDIVKEIKTLNKTDEFVQKPNKSLCKSPVNVLSVEEINQLNKVDFIEQCDAQQSINIEALNSKEESIKPVPEVTSNTQNINSNKTQVHSKTPVKFVVANPSYSESFSTEDSQPLNSLNNEVVASTPLPTKAFVKEERPSTPKSKGALFTKEPKSPRSPRSLTAQEYKAIKEEENSKINFDETVAVNNTSNDKFDAPTNIHDNSLNLLQQEPDYEAFKPKQQSTTLPFPDFKVLQEAALSVAKDIDTSLEKFEESEQFVSATTELFGDPSAFDFLSQAGSQHSKRGERYDSLYMRFDPLAQRKSMLPQKNLPASPSVDEEEVKESKVDSPITNMGTPKKNPALAAIDRLLFYSPQTPPVTQSEVAEAKQKKEEAEKPEPQLTPIVDEKMAKELELVRSTVLQLEAELEKQKQEHKEQLERQKAAFEERVNHMQTKFSQMQSQLTQEVKCKDQMTVVVEEYEKSISRLIAEREKDRTNFEAEKAKLQEELQVANQHLSNTEAAFSDVHSKYERLKNVVSAYKSNETVLKESIAENQETIKTLENRYEQLKSHAMAQLEKANLELSAIRKHNEAENVKLKALVRKAELKSKSLEETVEQKMKENKELTQIIDEMIARVE